MNSIIYVGMDIHKDNSSLCCYNFNEDALSVAMIKCKKTAEKKCRKVAKV